MTAPETATNAEGPATATSPRPKRWRRWAVPAGALVVGLVLGVAIGGGDPTKSEEYTSLQADLSAAEDQISASENAAAVAVRRAEAAEGAVKTAQDAAKTAETNAATRMAELDKREGELATREQAVAAIQQRITETTIREGSWTVGRDIEPGTYRTAAAVSGRCYWGIYVSGTNGSDIVDNDNVSGGFPTVTLRDGQDFTNHGCGPFIKE
jgi:hypothetical protein